MGRLIYSLKSVGLFLVVALLGATSLLQTFPVFAQTLSLEITTVIPAQAPNDIDTQVEIIGDGFSNVGGVPRVFLGSIELSDVIFENGQTLTAVIPWGQQPGVYTMRVVNPDGVDVSLASAFEVTQGVGQWNVSAMDGGPVHTVLPISSIPGLLYAHSDVTSAVYRSTDYAMHWETIGHVYGGFFTYDPVNPNYLYINSMQSTDGGLSWIDMLNNSPWPGTTKFAGQYIQTFPDPINSGIIYLAAADIPSSDNYASGLLRSEDYGQTWQPAETGLLVGDTNVTAMEFFGNHIYLGTRDGNLYQSTDEGSTWQRIGSSNFLESIGLIKVNPYKTNELWITTHYSVSATAKINILDLDNLANLSEAITQVSSWSEESYPRTLGFLSDNTVYIATQWDNGWISDNAGTTWQLLQPSTGKPGYSMALDPWDASQETFYIADEQYGVQKTTNASAPDWGNATWTPVNQGLHAMSPDYLKIDPSNPARVYAKISQNGWPGIFISQDSGQNWNFSSLESYSEGLRPITSMVAVSGGRVFVGAHGNDVLGYGPQIYISEDQGSTWNRKSLDPVPEYSTSFHMPFEIEADPQQPATLVLIVVIGNRTMTTDQYVSEIYRSTTDGDTWQRINLTSQIGYAIHNLSHLAFDPNDSNIVYASADHQILKSSDNGITWTVLKNDGSVNLNSPIAVEPIAPYRVYVGNLVSTDAGLSWEQVEMPLSPQEIAFVPGSDTVYISGDGLAYSYDGGSSWRRMDGAIGTTNINALAVGSVDQRIVIYVGTPGGDIAAADLSASSINTQSLSPLEAGIYRMTEVNGKVYLPLINH